MRVLFVSKDAGNARVGDAVARACERRGIEVLYVFDSRGRAWQSHQEGALKFPSPRNFFSADSVASV